MGLLQPTRSAGNRRLYSYRDVERLRTVRRLVDDLGVNLAAVHYHFGSKDELLTAVIQRKVKPVNEKRLALLTEYETAARFCPTDGTALRPKGSDSLVGCVLADRYHILKRIGEGGMGRV